jgi:hypothetical protein
MDWILKYLLPEALVYLDDLMVYSSTQEMVNDDQEYLTGLDTLEQCNFR